MLYQRTVSNICKSCKSKEEIKRRLEEKKILYVENDYKEFVNKSGEVIGKLIITIDLGEIDRSYYAKDYYGYEIFEMYKPYTYYFYSKMES